MKTAGSFLLLLLSLPLIFLAAPAAAVDTDGDGLSDADELVLGTDPGDADSDDDGLSDGEEVYLSTGTADFGPGQTVTNTAGGVSSVVAGDFNGDGDGLDDGFELTYGFDPLVGGEQSQDPDGDLLDNLGEHAAGTNPSLFSSDLDSLGDGAEVNTYGSLPKEQDTDGDGLLDGLEVDVHGTSPIDADSDDDGFSDGWEIDHGSDPTDAGSHPGVPALGFWARGVLAVLLLLAGGRASMGLRRRE